MKRALLIGANGTIGSALHALMAEKYDLSVVGRQQTNYSDESMSQVANELKQDGPFEIIICCIGVLHNDHLVPEKRLSHLSEAMLTEYFRINTILPALCLKHFSALLAKSSPSSFTFLSAMVGSITDNSLGGWYGYRSSKSALNMMVKTASIELARSHKNSAVAVIHPGTTRGPLSQPYSSGIRQDKYYTPEQTAERILAINESITYQNTGSFYNWDGTIIPW